MNKNEWAIVSKTLKNLYRTAQIHHEKNCEDFAYSSMIYFRYRFEKKRPAYPLSKEMEAVQHYLACKKFEKGPDFQYQVVFDERMLSCLAPYYCVLALLERCEAFAGGKSDRACDISVGIKGQVLTIQIQDSACEADQAQFFQDETGALQAMLERVDSFGVGELIFSEIESGTSVELRIRKKDGQIW